MERIQREITDLNFSTVQEFITKLEIALSIEVLDLVPLSISMKSNPLLFPFLPDRSHIRELS